MTQTMVAPATGALSFAFKGLGMARESVKKASNIRMNERRIVNERLLEGLGSMSEEFKG